MKHKPRYERNESQICRICDTNIQMEAMNTKAYVILGIMKTRMAALVKVEEIAEEIAKVTHIKEKHQGLIWR